MNADASFAAQVGITGDGCTATIITAAETGYAYVVGGATFTPSCPAGTIMVVVLTQTSDSPAAPPPDWQLISTSGAEFVVADPPDSNANVSLYWKRAGASEPPATFGSGQVEAWFIEFYGCIPTGNPIEASYVGYGSDAPLTTVTPGAGVFHFGCVADNSGNPAQRDASASIQAGSSPAGGVNVFSLDGTVDSDISTAFTGNLYRRLVPGPVDCSYNSLCYYSPSYASIAISLIPFDPNAPLALRTSATIHDAEDSDFWWPLRTDQSAEQAARLAAGLPVYVGAGDRHDYTGRGWDGGIYAIDDLTPPADALPDDLLVMVVLARDQTHEGGWVPAPDGWSVARQCGVMPVVQQSLSVFYKRCGDPGSDTVLFGLTEDGSDTTSLYAARIYAFRNVDTARPIESDVDIQLAVDPNLPLNEQPTPDVVKGLPWPVTGAGSMMVMIVDEDNGFSQIGQDGSVSYSVPAPAMPWVPGVNNDSGLPGLIFLSYGYPQALGEQPAPTMVFTPYLNSSLYYFAVLRAPGVTPALLSRNARLGATEGYLYGSQIASILADSTFTAATGFSAGASLDWPAALVVSAGALGLTLDAVIAQFGNVTLGAALALTADAYSNTFAAAVLSQVAAVQSDASYAPPNILAGDATLASYLNMMLDAVAAQLGNVTLGQALGLASDAAYDLPGTVGAQFQVVTGLVADARYFFVVGLGAQAMLTPEIVVAILAPRSQTATMSMTAATTGLLSSAPFTATMTAEARLTATLTEVN